MVTLEGRGLVTTSTSNLAAQRDPAYCNFAYSALACFRMADVGVGIFPIDPSLRAGCLLWWCEHDQHDSDDNQRRYVAQQMSPFAQVTECLHRHNSGMH